VANNGYNSFCPRTTLKFILFLKVRTKFKAKQSSFALPALIPKGAIARAVMLY